MEETFNSLLRDAANLKTRLEKISFGKSFLKLCRLSTTAIEEPRLQRSITGLIKIQAPTILMGKIVRIFYPAKMTNYPKRFCIEI